MFTSVEEGDKHIICLGYIQNEKSCPEMVLLHEKERKTVKQKT